MPSIIIVAFGSRGDIEPQLALASTLGKDSYWSEICICLQPDFAHLVPNLPNVRKYLLPMTMDDLFKALGEAIFISGNGRPAKDVDNESAEVADLAAKAIAKMTGHGFKLFAPTLFQLAENMRPGAIVGSLPNNSFCISIAEKLSIPVALLHLQPLSPTSLIPCPLKGIENSKEGAKIMRQIALAKLSGNQELILPRPEIAQANRESFKIGTRLWFAEQHKYINEFRASLNLKAMNVEDMLAVEEGCNESARMICAYPRFLAPLPNDCGSYIYQSGPLADEYIPPGWDPQNECPDLANFLEQGEAPVCISFGSMPDNKNAADITRIVFSGLQSAGVERGVLLPGRAGLSSQTLGPGDEDLKAWASSRVFETRSNVQYAWLLPRCRLFVTHGGAGSIASGLRAGIPLLVAPLGHDQVFWGFLVTEFELGATAGLNFTELTASELGNGIRKALQPQMWRRAQEYRERVCKFPGGAEETATLLKAMANRTLGTREEYEKQNARGR